ncbi:MAG TPA: SDR family NAD(P)-dependent oxidoreductase, partial [Chloroflexota bacterium]|nr:SDR family NAD(P)-dependent oxidoreductase [Chloroflexota bacterium]
IFITGSSDGLGRMAAQTLVDSGHQVVLHARSARRSAEALAAVPQAEAVVLGDLSSIEQMKDVGRQVNALGTFDAVIHNVGVGNREPQRIETVDGLPHVLAVNTLAPYVLTALITPPKRLVYLSSGLHQRGNPGLIDLDWTARPWDGLQAYADSKLHDVLLAFAVARLRPSTYSNSVEPGWVATRMGGPSAPDDLSQGPLTQAWLAAGADPATNVTGQHFYHQQPKDPHPQARNIEFQSALLAACAQLTDVTLG